MNVFIDACTTETHLYCFTCAATTMNVKQKIALGVLALGLTVTAAIAPQYIKASDHDDGEVTTKGRNRNLTDLFVFRENDQNPNSSADDLIFVMNTNPRSLPRQQYYFSPTARYEFHVTRVSNNDATPTGREDIVLRFEFDDPTANGQQEFKLTALKKDGTTLVATTKGKTTPLRPDPAAPPVINQLSLGGATLTTFAGLREDPFFLDVTQFFRVRGGFLDIGPDVPGFRPPERALDFTKDYNVNSIVVRVPRSFLRQGTPATTFDVWETISVKSPVTGKFTQFERLARPLINEGLVVTNAFLNAFNRIPPSADLSDAAAPVRAEALRTLQAFGNTPAEAGAIANAFLPDVMRIDTTGASGYANAFNAKGSPIRGRLLKDDVVDITLGVVTKGAVTTDNVTYKGVEGNPAQGHSPLQSRFPYLALPN